MPQDTLALIVGSGASEMLHANAQYLKRLGPMPTPFGLSAPLYRARMQNAHFLVMLRHGDVGEEIGAPWVNYRANVYALKEHGVWRILAWAGCAGVNPSLSVGEYVLPHDVADDTRGREVSFFKGTDLGFMRHHPVFCDELRAAVESTLRMQGIPYQAQGTYVCTQGPRAETPAEVKRLRSWGGDLVGMTMVPEVFLARELEMCYAGLCCVTGYAEGIRKREAGAGDPLGDVREEAEMAALGQARGGLLAIAASLSRSVLDDRTCVCSRAMERYRKAGRIGEDWHTWIGRP